MSSDTADGRREAVARTALGLGPSITPERTGNPGADKRPGNSEPVLWAEGFAFGNADHIGSICQCPPCTCRHCPPAPASGGHSQCPAGVACVTHTCGQTPLRPLKGREQRVKTNALFLPESGSWFRVGWGAGL